MKQELINKISYIVKSSINEAFDFNNVPIQKTIIDDTVRMYGCMNSNMLAFKKKIKTLFLDAFGIEAPAGCTHESKIGNIPVLYSTAKQFDINDFSMIDMECTYGSLICVHPLTRFSLSTEQALLSAGFIHYKGINTDNIMYPIYNVVQHDILQADAYVIDILNDITNTMGIPNVIGTLKVGDNVNSITDRYTQYSVYVSPDKGIIIIEALYYVKDKDIVLEKYLNPCILFTGKVLYELKNEKGTNKLQDEIKRNKKLHTLVGKILKKRGMPEYTGTSFGPLCQKTDKTYNVIPELDKKGRAVLVLGPKNNDIYLPIKDAINSPNDNTCIETNNLPFTIYPNCITFLTLTWKDDNQIYVKSRNKERAFFSAWDGSFMIYVTSDLKVIQRLFGKTVAEHCKTHGVAYPEKDPKTDYRFLMKGNWPIKGRTFVKIYGVMLFNDECSEEIVKLLNQ